MEGERKPNGSRSYCAAHCSDSGERIWACVSRKQKISIPVLLSAMGLNLEEILDNTRLFSYWIPRHYAKL